MVISAWGMCTLVNSLLLRKFGIYILFVKNVLLFSSSLLDFVLVVLLEHMATGTYFSIVCYLFEFIWMIFGLFWDVWLMLKLVLFAFFGVYAYRALLFNWLLFHLSSYIVMCFIVLRCMANAIFWYLVDGMLFILGIDERMIELISC